MTSISIRPFHSVPVPYAPINADPYPPPPGHEWGFAIEGVKKTLPGGQIFWQITVVEVYGACNTRYSEYTKAPPLGQGLRIERRWRGWVGICIDREYCRRLFKRQLMSPATVRFSLVCRNHGSFQDDHPHSRTFLLVANTRVDSIRYSVYSQEIIKLYL